MDSLLKVLAHFIEVREEELEGVASLSRLTPHFLQHSLLCRPALFFRCPIRLCAHLQPWALTSFLALLLKTPTVNLNLELLSNNVMNVIIEDWCIPQHDESPTNPAEAWKVPLFLSSAL